MANKVDKIPYFSGVPQPSKTSLPKFINYNGVSYPFPEVKNDRIYIDFTESFTEIKVCVNPRIMLIYDFEYKEFYKQILDESGLCMTNNVSSEEIANFTEVMKIAVKSAESAKNKRLTNQLKRYFEINKFF